MALLIKTRTKGFRRIRKRWQPVVCDGQLHPSKAHAARALNTTRYHITRCVETGYDPRCEKPVRMISCNESIVAPLDDLRKTGFPVRIGKTIYKNMADAARRRGTYHEKIRRMVKAGEAELLSPPVAPSRTPKRDGQLNHSPAAPRTRTDAPAGKLATFEKTRVVARFYDHPLIRELYPESHWTWRRLVGRKSTNESAAEVLLINGPSLGRGGGL